MSSLRYILVGVISILLLGIQNSSAATTPSDPKFSYHTFATCSEFENTLKKILPTTYNDGRLYKGGVMFAESAVPPTTARLDTANPKSETNVQVKGIDEADIVKTDGKYLYSYQEGERAIVILDAKTLARIKSIKVPTNYSGVSFYITKNKLILTATKSVSAQNGWTYWYNNSQKSVIALYDISSPLRASLVRNIEVDGYLSDTRLSDTGIMTAVVATSYWMPPIYRSYLSDSSKMIQPAFDYSSKNLIPRISDQQFSQGKVTSVNRALGDCTSMSSILPSTETLADYSLSPTLTSIIRFDTTVPKSPITSQVVLSDAGQIHVTQDSVYLTANMWSPKGTTTPCPINARCMSPLIWNPGTSSTLVHRFAVSNTNIRYSYSRIVSGSPLSQYSMNEDASGNFHIVTTVSSWSGSTNNSSTKLSILSRSGTIVGSLSDIAPGENFQSSRFIGGRLYLVTFEQIDPLFVIDVADSKNPKILGELKIPGYSTYLHPYDANRLIGVGYDTVTNQWGGTTNGGVKIDVYNVSDVKNPQRESTLTLGDVGSSSDILWNPKAFVWYKEKNLLLMPATLMTSAGDKENMYLSKSAFQGLVGISITPSSIVEKFRISHITLPTNISETWKKECDNLAKANTGYKPYIPEYCTSSGTVDMYIANNIWNYSSDFISRVLYVGENLYTIGNSRIQSQNFANPTVPTALAKFKIQNQYGYPMPVDVMTSMSMTR